LDGETHCFHDAQRHDAGWGAADGIERQRGELDEAEGEIGDEGTEIVFETIGDVEQAGEGVG